MWQHLGLFFGTAWLMVTWTQAVTIRPDQQEAIDLYINDILQCTGIPGLALSIVSENTEQVTQAYGIGNLQTGAPLSVDNTLIIGSLTKHFTAILLAKLMSESQG